MILDAKQLFGQASCSRQNCRLRELLMRDTGENIQLRSYTPPAGGWACQHSKTLVLDGVVYVGGSPNLTGNSQHSYEEAVMTREKKTVMAAMRSFAAVWEASQVVTVERMLAVSRMARCQDAGWPGGDESR